MDEIRPLLLPKQEESTDLPSPNLRPRHRELIPTPCGPIKPWSELPCLVKVYFCFAILSLLVLLTITVLNMHLESQGTYPQEEKENFTVSLIQVVGILFCLYYISRGILQENRQELIVFVLSMVVVMMRSVVNFAVLKTYNTLLTVRFVCILCVGLAHVICTTLLLQRPNMMAFRVGGALESLQEQYYLLNVCFSMVTFDLQAQLCLFILMLMRGTSSTFEHSIILGIGVVWACVAAATGAFAVLKEVKPLVWLFVFLNLPELAYFIYLLYTIITGWGQSETLEAAAIMGCAVAVVIKSVLFRGLFRLYRNFGQGLRERMFASDNH